MGQGDIFDLLKANPDNDYTERQMEAKLEKPKHSLSEPLARLRKNEEVKFFKGPPPPSGGKPVYYYRHKRITNTIRILQRY